MRHLTPATAPRLRANAAPKVSGFPAVAPHESAPTSLDSFAFSFPRPLGVPGACARAGDVLASGVETPAEHVRNALAILTLGVQVGELGAEELRAVARRLDRALEQLEGPAHLVGGAR